MIGNDVYLFTENKNEIGHHSPFKSRLYDELHPFDVFLYFIQT